MLHKTVETVLHVDLQALSFPLLSRTSIYLFPSTSDFSTTCDLHLP